MSRHDAIAEARTLDDLYDLIPFARGCKGQCAEACGPIGFSVEEGRRIAAAGAHIPNVNEVGHRSVYVCPALTDRRCSIYRDRPTVCRLWGVSEPLPCPHAGCFTLDPLTVDEASAISQRAFEIGGFPL